VNITTRVMSAAVLSLALAATPTLAEASTTAATQPTHAQATAPATSTASTEAASKPVTLRLSSQELAQWKYMVSTDAGRQRVVDDLKTAFDGIATVGAGVTTAPSDGVQPNLATGITGDHFWITASYADIADGAIWAGVRACQTKLPAWLCTQAGNLLTSWAAGWGAGNDHGVWAAIYWWPPHITGGRW